MVNHPLSRPRSQSQSYTSSQSYNQYSPLISYQSHPTLGNLGIFDYNNSNSLTLTFVFLLIAIVSIVLCVRSVIKYMNDKPETCKSDTVSDNSSETKK